MSGNEVNNGNNGRIKRVGDTQNSHKSAIKAESSIDVENLPDANDGRWEELSDERTETDVQHRFKCQFSEDQFKTKGHCWEHSTFFILKNIL